LGLEPLVRLTGPLPPSAVSAYLQACDAIALPSDEGASFRRGSLLAALEHGCAVVTTPPVPAAEGYGARRLVPGSQFLAVPAGAPAALAAAIQRLERDRALVNQ